MPANRPSSRNRTIPGSSKPMDHRIHQRTQKPKSLKGQCALRRTGSPREGGETLCHRIASDLPSGRIGHRPIKTRPLVEPRKTRIQPRHVFGNLPTSPEFTVRRRQRESPHPKPAKNRNPQLRKLLPRRKGTEDQMFPCRLFVSVSNRRSYDRRKMDADVAPSRNRKRPPTPLLSDQYATFELTGTAKGKAADAREHNTTTTHLPKRARADFSAQHNTRKRRAAPVYLQGDQPTQR